MVSHLDEYPLHQVPLPVTWAGVPAGVVNIVAGGREVGEHLVAHPGIDKVAFTGSTAAGRKIAADPATEVGPMVAQRQQERVEKYIALGQEEGARMVLGGNGMPAGLDRGWYVQPTIFADVDNRMRIAQEEIFGPVLCVIPYDDVDDAVRIANDSEYGLAGTVWTADQAAGLDVARRVRTGTYGVNTYTMDFSAPFGGYKNSGVGREFGPEGLSQYTEMKSIYVESSTQ